MPVTNTAQPARHGLTLRAMVLTAECPDAAASLLADFTGNQGTDPLSLRYELDHCIVKVDELLDPTTGFPDFFDHCNACLTPASQEALFAEQNEDDYHLDTLSVAEEMALPIPGILIDLEGNDRDLTMPDIGCFEYIYE